MAKKLFNLKDRLNQYFDLIPNNFIYLIHFFVYLFRFPHAIVSPKSIVVNTKLGRGVKIYRGVLLKDCEVGDHTYITSNFAITSIVRDTKIGKYCSIGPNFQCLSRSHNLKNLSTYPFLTFGWITKQNEDAKNNLTDMELKRIEIGNDVWIGANVIILGGVKVGNGAVLGAGSVVTKNVEPYAIVAGNPARLIRYRIKENVINHLMKIRWWDMEEDIVLQESKTLLGNDAYSLKSTKSLNE